MATAEQTTGYGLETAGDETPLETGSKLELKRHSINRELYKFFPPDLAQEALMLPVAKAVVRGSGQPLNKQEWVLTVAVAEQFLPEVRREPGYYAEQIRDSDLDYWPGKLSLNILPTSKEQVTSRLPAQRNAWAMRRAELELVMPKKEAVESPEEAPPPPEQSLEEARRAHDASYGEITRTLRDEELKAPPSTTSDQIMDLSHPEGSLMRRLVQTLFAVGIAERASDIHLEYQRVSSEEMNVRCRLRIDGVLVEKEPYNMLVGPSMLNVLGQLAGNVIETDSLHKVPQDGKAIILTKDKRRFDARMAFVPVTLTNRSFNCTIRLLDSTRVFEFSKLDLSEHNETLLRQEMLSQQGMIVLTGITGSGKSTTILAMLREIISPEKKVITIEDPVEGLLRGAEQIQVDYRDSRTTFPAHIRAALRRDPEVFLIGEIRDTETANAAVEAALTGHLVSTTVHTQNLLQSVERLTQLGVHPHLAASAMSVAGGQHLVRRIDAERWHWVTVPIERIEDELGVKLVKDTSRRDAPFKMLELNDDCELGDYKNYHGRVGIHSFVRFSEEMKSAISSGAKSRELWPLAMKAGMRSILRDALEKVQRGLTSLDEVKSVLHGHMAATKSDGE